MSDGNMLKRILEAENSGRELVREAQEKADARVRDVLAALQEDFRAAREGRLRQILERAREQDAGLRKLQTQRLAGFERNLREQSVSFEDAAREARRILAALPTEGL
jgi:vacuolar-type H+-ATPase subunit H